MQVARLKALGALPPAQGGQEAAYGCLKQLGLERERFDRDREAVPREEPAPQPDRRESFRAYRQAMQAYWAGIRALEACGLSGEEEGPETREP